MEKPKIKKFELETGECGHEVPFDFMVYDREGCGTCMKCYAENLVHLLKLERKKNKSKPSEVNCLAYALRFWEKHPEYRLFYNSGHVINIPATFIKSDSDIKWLPAEKYGYNYFKSSYKGLLNKYEMQLLRKYFSPTSQKL